MWRNGLKYAVILLGIVLGSELYATDQDVERAACVSEQDAVGALLSELLSAKVYSEILTKCFFLERESHTPDAYQFAVRFEKGKCGGSSTSTVIGRFLVRRSTCEVVYYYVARDRYVSLRDSSRGLGGADDVH